MILEVKQWPESQDVMDNPDWFFIQTGESDDEILGNSAYAKMLDESEYKLIRRKNGIKRASTGDID